MSRPVPNFVLGKLDFQNRMLAPSSSEAPTQLDSSSKAKPHEQDKEAILSNGKSIILKKRNRKKPVSMFSNSVQKENYGFSINELFAKLEVQRLKETVTSKRDEVVPKEKKPFLSKNIKSDSALWAEKWRPRNFLDFVGNEVTNRRILTWLKQWDKVVFEKNMKPITGDSSNTETKLFTDTFGRPSRKVLLIHGPPGIGKTTIAHVIAKQCGYEVTEINASDERAGQRVKEKIGTTLTTTTFSGKPVCLVADEVDGASEFGFVKVLLDILKEDERTLKKFERMQSGKFWQEGHGQKLLLRPIIAICNDIYSPALEKLRVQAEIITFQQVGESALRERLKFICQKEDLSFNNAQLKEIMYITNFDIRSCLNILQFSGSSPSSHKKDLTTSWFSIVQRLFYSHPRTPKRAQFKDIQATLNTHDTYEKIIAGSFAAYIAAHYQDIGLRKPSAFSDWLFFSDLAHKTQFDSNGADLSYYSSITALKVFDMFSDASNSQLRAKSDWSWVEKTRDNNAVSRMIRSNLSPSLKTLFRLQDMSMELLPSMDYIVAPQMSKRTMAGGAGAMAPSEKLKLWNAIEAIEAVGLMLNKTRDESYNEIVKTFPDFTTITRFEPIDVKKQYLRQTLMHPLLSKEMEQRRAKRKRHDTAAGSSDSGGAGSITRDGIESLKTQYAAIEDGAAAAKRQKIDTNVRIWVRWNEGYSNAVRKKVRWSDLF